MFGRRQGFRRIKGLLFVFDSRSEGFETRNLNHRISSLLDPSPTFINNIFSISFDDEQWQDFYMQVNRHKINLLYFSEMSQCTKGDFLSVLIIAGYLARAVRMFDELAKNEESERIEQL